MLKIRINYAVLLLAFALAVVSGLGWVAALEPWPSLVSMVAIVTVQVRLIGFADGTFPRHERAQRRTIIFCVIIGVITAFQWLLSVKQLEGLDLRRVLHEVVWLLFWITLAHPIVGLALTFDNPFGPRPAKPATQAAAAGAPKP